MAHILVVDDHDAVRRTIRQMLEAAGHVVVEACDGLAALQVLIPEVELIITDVIMPEMDGLEMIRNVRQKGPNLPSLVVTGGWGAPSDLVSIAVKLGADHAISKAKIPTELMKTVAQMVRR